MWPIKLKRERYAKRKFAWQKEKLFLLFSTFLPDEIDFNDAWKNNEDYSELIYLMKQKLQFCNQIEKI